MKKRKKSYILFLVLILLSIISVRVYKIILIERLNRVVLKDDYNLVDELLEQGVDPNKETSTFLFIEKGGTYPIITASR